MRKRGCESSDREEGEKGEMGGISRKKAIKTGAEPKGERIHQISMKEEKAPR